MRTSIMRARRLASLSLLSITAISLFMPTQAIVPSIFMLEVAASLNLIPSIWREIDWRGLAWLLLGYVIGLAPGIYALVYAPEAPLQGVEVRLGIIQPVGMIESQRVHPARVEQLEQQRVRLLEHLIRLHAEGRELVDIEEAPVVDLLGGDVPGGEAIVLCSQQLIEPVKGRGLTDRAVDGG